MRLPRLKRKTVVILALVAVALIGIGIWGWMVWQRARDHAAVKVSGAVSWEDRDYGSNGAASQVTVVLETPYHRPYADAEVVIETWTDDCGTDLLISALRTSHVLEGGYSWETGVSADKGGFHRGPRPVIVPRPNSSTPKMITWTIGSPVEVSPQATLMRVKGYVQFREGRDCQSVRVGRADLRPGTHIQLGESTYTIEHMDEKAVTLQSSGLQTPLVAVRFENHEGREVAKAGSSGLYGWSSREQRRVDEPIVRHDTIPSPYRSGYAAIIIDYWSQVWTKTIPFDVTVPLTRQAPVSFNTLVEGPTKLIAPPSSQDDVKLERVPDDAWGPLASETQVDLIEVMPSKSPWPHHRPEALADLDVEIKKPALTASYDFTVTGFHDSEGNQLLRPRPVKSAVGQYSGLECERYWRSIGNDETEAGQPYIPSWIEIITFPSPSSKATSVDFEGFVKLKVMDSFKTLDIENFVIDNKIMYTVGPVQLSFGMADDKGHILVFSRGDFGLIRELEFLAQDGTLLHHEQRSIPHLYWNNTAIADVRSFDRMNDVKRLRVRYCSDYHHYVLPFKVTVPLKKQE